MGGFGPGGKEYIIPRFVKAISQCSVVVGYKKYIEILDKELKLAADKEFKAFRMRTEKERAKYAVTRSLEGENVFVVSSGDAGVYGMAGLVIEEAQKYGIEVEIIPGITAALAGAALLGAPLACDFVVLNLSDILVSWEEIKNRLRAAASGDFVIAIYNPASKNRKWQLPKAAKIILSYRKESTPVGIVKNGYRENEEVIITSLGDLEKFLLDMNTVLIIGNSASKVINGKIVTSRGYK